MTGGEGDFTLPNLAPGNYKVTAQFKGFSTAVVSSTSVRVEQTARVDFSLSPGATTDSECTGQLELVQSTTSDLGQVIESQADTGTAPQRTAVRTTGHDRSRNGAGRLERFCGKPVGGRRADADAGRRERAAVVGNYYMVDGVHNTEPLNAFISITPPLDSIDSFKVETSNPNAEYGSFGGAIVNLTIKSGTNTFHGEAFDFCVTTR